MSWLIKLDNSKLGSTQQWMTLTCCQDHILTENIWFVWSETSYSGDERRCDGCGTTDRPKSEDRATQPMEAADWVSQFEFEANFVSECFNAVRMCAEHWFKHWQRQSLVYLFVSHGVGQRRVGEVGDRAAAKHNSNFPLPAPSFRFLLWSKIQDFLRLLHLSTCPPPLVWSYRKARKIWI